MYAYAGLSMQTACSAEIEAGSSYFGVQPGVALAPQWSLLIANALEKVHLTKRQIVIRFKQLIKKMQM